MSAVVQPGNDIDPAPIWRRQKGETEQAWAAFVVYREQVPPRSIPKAARALGKGVRTLGEFSRKYNWVERATAYTDHLDRIALAAHEDDIIRRRREVNEEIFQLAAQARTMAAARMVGMQDEDGKFLVVPLDPNTFDPDDVMRWFETSTKVSRLAIGLPTDVTGSIQVSLNDVQRVLGGFLELAEKRMTEEQFEGLVRDCSAMVREQLGA